MSSLAIEPHTPPRQLRARHEHITFSPGSRAVLSPRESATLLRTPGHDCGQSKEVNTVAKVMARLGFSLYRFAVGFSWECQTLRGRTRYNGGRTHCGQGKCEAAHAALSPTLYDDKLKKIKEELETTPFHEISAVSQIYMTHRFQLSQEGIDQLSLSDTTARMHSFTDITNKLSKRQKKGSIAETSLEKQRNATFSNLRSGNRFDCYLERSLRPKEDSLAQECSNHLKEPEEAFLDLLDCYQKLISEAETNLTAEQTSLKEFETAWDGLIEAQKGLSKATDQEYAHAFIDYKKAVKGYLDLYNVRTKCKESGVPSHKSLMKSLKEHQSPRLLKGVLKQDTFTKIEGDEWFQNNSRYLSTQEAALKAKFTAAKKNVDERLLEAMTQKKEMPETAEEVHRFVKRSLAVKDDNGTLITPKKSPLAKALIKTLSPAFARRGF